MGARGLVLGVGDLGFVISLLGRSSSSTILVDDGGDDGGRERYDCTDPFSMLQLVIVHKTANP